MTIIESETVRSHIIVTLGIQSSTPLRRHTKRDGAMIVAGVFGGAANSHFSRIRWQHLRNGSANPDIIASRSYIVAADPGLSHVMCDYLPTA